MYNKEEHFIVTHIEQRNKREVKKGRFYCINLDRWYDTLGGLRNGIRPTGLTVEEYYIKYYKKDDEGYCQHCKIVRCTFNDVVEGYHKFCSAACANTRPEKRKIISERFVGCPEKKEESLRKRKETRALFTDDKIQGIKDKQRNTRMINDPDGVRLRKNGRLGFDALQIKISNDPTIRDRITEKMLETKRINGTFSNGMSGKIKTIIFEDKEYKYQGYEDILLKFLIEKNINFVSGGDIVPIRNEYVVSKKYMPDFYLPDYNLIIDIKSERTFNLSPAKLLEKQISTFKAGYHFIHFVIHGKTVKKNRILCDDDKMLFNKFLNMLISSQALRGRFNDYPVIRSTLQAIGSGSSGDPRYLGCDIV